MKKTIFLIALILASFVFGLTLGNANFYEGAGRHGVSWNGGGVEVSTATGDSVVAVYLCDASYDRTKNVSTHYHYDSQILNSLVVEC